jgi:hypothetical protein
MRNALRVVALIVLSASLSTGTWLCLQKDAGRLDIPWWLATLPFTWPLILVAVLLALTLVLGCVVALMVPSDRCGDTGDIWH